MVRQSGNSPAATSCATRTWPLRISGFKAASLRKKSSPRASPMKLVTPYIQSLSVASSESRPFHRGSAKPSSVPGSSSRLTLPVLKPTTQRLARSPNQRRCEGIAQGGRSEERRVGKSVDLGGRRIIKKKKKKKIEQ